MPTRTPTRSVVALAAGLDAALLLLFVLIGRASHGEDLWGVLTTWWPFLAGLVVAWVARRAWRQPLRIRWNGLAIWLITVVVGLLLRVVSQQGVQFSFVVVTFLVVGAFLVGWRAIWALVHNLRHRTQVGSVSTR